MNMIRKAAHGSVGRLPAEVHQLRHRLADAFQHPMDGIGLYAMQGEFSDDLVFVFRKNRRNVTHLLSISERL